MLSKKEILEKEGFDFEVFQSENEYSAKSILNAMEEFATQKSIAFAEWINSEGYREYDGYDRWIAPQNSSNVYETKQLYEMFLKDKNGK